ncbi:MAG: mechanosensitive ion channel family protein [Candidatus Rokubacteria bacterium]|nr:mechanosensitive ion channel family protein [Candidatus Rokubacteria bacterium]
MMTTLGQLLARGLRLEGFEVHLTQGLTILAVLIASVLVYQFVKALIDRLFRPLVAAGLFTAKTQRALTLGPILKSLARYLIAFVALMIVLDQFGVDIKAILISAGVVGLAVSLGAQALVRDIIMGFVILFEGLIAVGDVIEVGSHTGEVEAVGLRVTKIRKLSGAQLIVPNGELTQFGSYTHGWARAVVDVGIPYEVEVDRALVLLEAVGRRWGEESSGVALGSAEAQGIIRFGDSEMILRLQVKVDARQRAAAENELRRRIKAAFDKEGITIPYPQRVVHWANRPLREESAG